MPEPFFGNTTNAIWGIALNKKCTIDLLLYDLLSWVYWPASCEEAVVLRFFRRHTDRLLLSADEHDFRPAKRQRCISTPNKPVPGSASNRKLNIGLAYTISDL